MTTTTSSLAPTASRSVPPRRRRRAWPWIVGCAVFFGGSGLVAARVLAKPAPIDPALVVHVVRKSLDVEILETGRVGPREKVDLKSKIPGQVRAVTVREGASVRAGDVLVVLEPVDYQRELARAEAEVARAAAVRDFARVSLRRAERGVEQGVAPSFELTQTRHEERTAMAALRGAEVSRAVAQDRLAYTKITSPIDGIVIARGIEPGESVVPGVQSTFDGKALLTIADLSSLLVVVNLNQIDVAKVAVGRKATLTLDALPGKTYEAEITKVAPASVKLAGKDQEVFPVEATVARPDGLVKPGMTADVRIRLDAKAGALSLPVEAVTKASGKTFVTRIRTRDGRSSTEKVDVTLGLTNDREVEVIGLDEGDSVLLRPPSAAENETKI